MADVDISCLCGKGKSRVRLTDNVPAHSFICHRSQCRHNMGSLCHSVLPITGRPQIVATLEVYIVDNSLSRYFCGTCGSHMIDKSEGWAVQSGCVERIHSEQVSSALEEIAGHEYVHETLDGGLSFCLAGEDPSGFDRRMQEIEPSFSAAGAQNASIIPNTISMKDDRERLWASCICGGVQFFITKPNEQSVRCSSPWPDLIVPYHADSSDNPRDEKWWIRDDGKWLAGTCACRSCRLGLGAPIQAWAFVSRSNIFNPDASKLSYKTGSLRTFESSAGARREFCHECGATIFWHNEERPGVVDVSVGILRASEGSLARTWLNWWTERVSFAEHAFDKRLIQQFEAGLHRSKSS